jgi:hypothetical protein
MRRIRFRTRVLMIAVAVVALVLGGSELARRRFFPPPPQPGAPWYPGQFGFRPDGQGGVWIWESYNDLDEGMKAIRHPRVLELHYRIRRWGRLTWADSITERIYRPDAPGNIIASPEK